MTEKTYKEWQKELTNEIWMERVEKVKELLEEGKCILTRDHVKSAIDHYNSDVFLYLLTKKDILNWSDDSEGGWLHYCAKKGTLEC
jgi:hypothetical protein